MPILIVQCTHQHNSKLTC